LFGCSAETIENSPVAVKKEVVFESLDNYFDHLAKHNKFVGSVGLYKMVS